jgi:hypothetical protein
MRGRMKDKGGRMKIFAKVNEQKRFILDPSEFIL